MSTPMDFVRAGDRWHSVDADDSVVAVPAAEPDRILTIAQWEAVKASWPESLPTGLAVPNDVDIETVVADLPRLRLVALSFPKWTDGRAYSQARLLRERYGFAGQIRATGEVLVDMLPLLQRCGFDAAQLRADQKIDSAKRALGFFPQGHYQGDVVEPKPLFARFHAAPNQ